MAGLGVREEVAAEEERKSMGEKLSRRDAVLALGTAVAGPAITSASVTSRLASYNVVTPPVTDLRGKTLVVRSSSRPLECPLILGGCSLETHGGRLFLSGTNVPHAPDSSNWTDGIRRLVAWEAVEEYMVFDSVEQYHDRLILPAETSRAEQEAAAHRPGE
jgi:hypothetical protein